MKRQDLAVIGWVEKVDLPEYGLFGVPAKIDTGAYSGALHCEYERQVIDEAGKTWLEYKPLHSSKNIRTKEFKAIKVISSNGEQERRFRVNTEIVINNKTYPLSITLSDRSNLTYDVILGRNFLAGKFIVNPQTASGQRRSERL